MVNMVVMYIRLSCGSWLASDDGIRFNKKLTDQTAAQV
jgi:hypothetical protein